MSRPYVNLSIKNEVNDLLVHLNSKIPEFKSLSGVIGITLNGGLSRGFADHLSEIDITFYLDSENYEIWENKKSPIPLGIVKLDNILYDIKIINLEEEFKRKYGDIDKWDLSYAQILYDPNNKISQLFKEKLSTRPDISEATSLLWESYWNFKLAGDIWINRGDVLQGHFIMNEAIKPLIKALFIVNKEYIPHEKWLIHMSHTLKWKPKDWKVKLTDAMSIDNSSSLEDLERRQCTIEELFNEISDYLKENYYPEFSLAIHQKYFYDLLKYLVERESIPVKEWKKISAINQLNTDPFHKVTEIQGDKVVLNKGRLLSIKAEDMYDWHYEIVKGVIEDLKLS